MRLLFLSDIHGSPDNLPVLSQVVQERKPELIVILGDILYHGPRNGVKPGYNPSAVVELLNGWKEKILAVRGNCDCEVDQMLLQFPMLGEYSTLLVDGTRFFLSHGHHWNLHNPPPLGCCSVLAGGHTHIPDLHRDAETGLLLFNPGSVSLPKGGFPATFGWYEDRNLQISPCEEPEKILFESAC